jgi:two-component system cell cycle sensor histidine kinase/response regulator CckA
MPANILIVEDEQIIAKGIENCLKGMGYGVAGLASSGEEAVAQALALRPDLILMDIHLDSGIDGVEAARRIQEQLDVPIVYLTAYSDDATLQRAKLTGPFGYVLKPYEDKDLQTTIEIGLYKHQMERRLRESEQWLATTLASIGDGVIATTQEGRVRFMNPLAERLTGWTQNDALHRDISEVLRLIDKQTQQSVGHFVQLALQKGETALPPHSQVLNRTGNHFPIDGTVTPIRQRDGQVMGVAVVFRDISERCRLEEHLRQTYKLEAIGRLAGGIAHEYNNLLTIILGFSEFLLMTGLPPALQSQLQQIHDAGQRASTLTQQIMAFGRKQWLAPSVQDLNTVVRGLSGMIKRVIGPDIELVKQADPALGLVKIDPIQIGQAILNLAENARDAMPNGGKLTIATSNVECTEALARQFVDMKPGRYALLSITDTGCGMSPEVLSHLFEPFFTTKGLGRASGMGLASVHGIVKQSGGHISVSSRVGEGTSFHIYLPVIDEELAAPPEKSPTTLKEQPDETILLVEDEEAVRKMTRIALEQKGYKVLEAADGREGLEVAQHYQGPIHLVLTDMVMPRMSGQEMAERLTAERPGLRVLVMSGNPEMIEAQESKPTPNTNFIHKPFSLVFLAQKVREILDKN